LTLTVLLTLILFASATRGGGAQASDSRASDEAAVRGAVKELESGWNAKSGALFAKPFAEDSDYVVINGMRIRGRAAIAEGHQRIFDTVYKGTTLALAVEQVRFLRADVAVAHVSARLRMQQAQGAQEAEAVITLVLTKEAGAWQIVAFQNTRVEGR
jgi:uncharacterized protein (TIGR02246 family)